jgi:hypothetical protein
MPADFGKLIADETEKWGKVVKFAGSRRPERRPTQIFHKVPFRASATSCCAAACFFAPRRDWVKTRLSRCKISGTPSYVNTGNRCSFISELPAGPAVVPPINGSVGAVGRTF